jgi:hypothetical protein
MFSQSNNESLLKSNHLQVFSLQTNLFFYFFLFRLVVPNFLVVSPWQISVVLAFQLIMVIMKTRLYKLPNPTGEFMINFNSSLSQRIAERRCLYRPKSQKVGYLARWRYHNRPQSQNVGCLAQRRCDITTPPFHQEFAMSVKNFLISNRSNSWGLVPISVGFIAPSTF